jgi:hypothetical protein
MKRSNVQYRPLNSQGNVQHGNDASGLVNVCLKSVMSFIFTESHFVLDIS